MFKPYFWSNESPPLVGVGVVGVLSNFSAKTIYLRKKNKNKIKTEKMMENMSEKTRESKLEKKRSGPTFIVFICELMSHRRS